MDRKKIYIIAGSGIIIILIIISLLSARKPKINIGLINVTTCEAVDERNLPINPNSVFASTIPEIWLSAKIVNAPPKTKLSVGWFGPNKKMLFPPQEISFEEGGTSYFSLVAEKPGTLWALGDYQIIFNINNVRAKVYKFKIKKPEELQKEARAGYLSQITLTPKINLDSSAQTSQITEFSPETQTIYVSIYVLQPPTQIEVEAKWYYEETGALLKKSTALVDSAKYIAFSIDRFKESKTPTKLWEEGVYRLELYVDKDLVYTLPFQIYQ